MTDKTFRLKPVRGFIGSLSLSLCLSAHAGFLQDFYDNAGAQTSYTSAGLYASSSMDLLTGGRFVVKVPRRDFEPYYLQAPHLKAGCGGIDVFLGAFSVPSKEEFLNFLRSIGTALPGLAFQLALQSLAPDLNEQVAQFRDMLMRLSREMGDSCHAAQTLLDSTGASQWITGMGQRARNALRSTGQAEDQSDADAMTRTDGGKVLDNVPERRDTEGNLLEASELNLTWALLKGGKSPLSTDNREVMMTLVGTTVYVKAGSGADTTVEERSFGPLDLLNTMLGEETSESLPADALIYRCDETEKCLNPTRGESGDINLTHAIYQAMLRYRQSLVERDPKIVKDGDLPLLIGISSIPLMNLVEISASPRLLGFSDAYLQTYAQAAAYEGLLTAVAQLASDLKTAVSSSSGRDANDMTHKHAELIESRLTDLLADLRQREQAIVSRMSRVNAFLAEVSHLRRVVYGDAAAEALTVLPAGGKVTR